MHEDAFKRVDDPDAWIEKAFKKNEPIADNVVIRGLRD